MGNNIQIFKNEQFGEIRTVANENNEPLFVANDVATMLGYANPRDAIANHVDEEDKATVAIHDGSQNRNMVVITESGFYSLVLSSKIEKAKKVKKWVTSEVLPSIRKNGYYVNNKFATNHLTPTKVRASIEWVKGVREVLNLNDSSTLLMLKQVSEPLGLPTPDYTPSKGQLLAPTVLLQQHGVQISTREFNQKMIGAGFIKELQRPSSNGKIKYFKSLTEKAAGLGENQINPSNPKETQPLYYADKFEDLFFFFAVI